MHGGLAVHLCILFNLFLCHSFLPADFMACTISPIVKCNNYGAITLSNAVTKILETVLLEYTCNQNADVDYQFGFKQGTSTSVCTNTFKPVVDYYRRRGSNVFVGFADFSKAFDRVNHVKLFKQLLSDGVHIWMM